MSQANKTRLIVGFAGVLTAILLFGLGRALLPLIIGFGLAYFSFPLIKGLEQRGIKRNYAVVGVFAFIGIIILLLLVQVVPILVEETRLFFHELPQTSATAADKVKVFISKFGYSSDISRQEIKQFLAEHSSTISGSFLESFTNFLKSLFSNFIHSILFILSLFLIPIFFFHLVNKYEVIFKEVKDLIPIPWRPKLKQYIKLADTVLNGYIRGQMLVIMILATLYGFGYWVIGLKFGLLIGIVTGLMTIIPFVGSVLGVITAFSVALANYTGIWSLMSVVMVFGIIQSLEALFITPKLVGNKVGLDMLTTMLALIIGGHLFGFVGMIIAIPITAILKSILKDLKQEYKTLPFYKG